MFFREKRGNLLFVRDIIKFSSFAPTVEQEIEPF